MPVHTYDVFEIHGNEVHKASVYGVEVTDGQDSLPLVQGFLSRFSNIVYHKGQIADFPWDGSPISVYVDDACKYKDQFLSALQQFSKAWIPGVTVCAFMDYWWYLSRPQDPAAKFQKDYLSTRARCFEPIMEDKALGIKAFRYLGGLVV